MLLTSLLARFCAMSPHSANDTLVVMAWIGTRSTDPSLDVPQNVSPSLSHCKQTLQARNTLSSMFSTGAAIVITDLL